MDHLAPLGPVYQAGTLSGNPVATAAGLAVLGLLDDGCVRPRSNAPRRCSSTASPPRSTKPASTCRPRVRGPSAACSSPTSRCATTTTPKRADHERYARFFHGMLERGVYLAPSGYETFFPSLAHTDDDLALTLHAAAEVATTL